MLKIVSESTSTQSGGDGFKHRLRNNDQHQHRKFEHDRHHGDGHRWRQHRRQPRHDRTTTPGLPQHRKRPGGRQESAPDTTTDPPDHPGHAADGQAETVAEKPRGYQIPIRDGQHQATDASRGRGGSAGGPLAEEERGAADGGAAERPEQGSQEEEQLQGGPERLRQDRGRCRRRRRRPPPSAEPQGAAAPPQGRGRRPQGEAELQGPRGPQRDAFAEAQAAPQEAGAQAPPPLPGCFTRRQVHLRRRAGG